MAPGLCYLAAFGSEFLEFADNLLKKRRPSSGNHVTSADLPVDGDADRVIETHQLDGIESGSKPIWWYLGLFPIWCKIASYGQANMLKRLSEEGEVNINNNNNADVNEEEILVPNGREFMIAIFFIVFGVIAVIAGVGSNIYVQVVGQSEDEYY